MWILEKCAKRKIKIIGFQIGNFPQKSFLKFQKEYLKRGGLLYEIKKFHQKMNAKEISNKFKNTVVISARAAAPKEIKK